MVAETETPGLAVVGSAGWRLQFHKAVFSTNDLARDLPAWSAVVAGSQAGGRGRFGRPFVSDEGGLWLTGVVPAPGGPARWSALSLVVGLHLLRLAERLGVQAPRLRWPNDLMVGGRKLAGILIEQGRRETYCVGVGMNVSNAPWLHDPALELTACRLCELTAPAPDPRELAPMALDAIADAHEDLAAGGAEAAIQELNERWHPHNVRLDLHGGKKASGLFLGLDSCGNLLLREAGGRHLTVPHHEVRQLTEEGAGAPVPVFS